MEGENSCDLPSSGAAWQFPSWIVMKTGHTMIQESSLFHNSQVELSGLSQSTGQPKQQGKH